MQSSLKLKAPRFPRLFLKSEQTWTRKLWKDQEPVELHFLTEEKKSKETAKKIKKKDKPVGNLAE